MELKELLKTKLVDAKHHGQKAISLSIEDVETLLSMMPEWVKCSDRLPELDSVVLVCDEDSVGIAQYISNYWTRGKPDFLDFQDEQPSTVFATHWMPLPKPPTE